MKRILAGIVFAAQLGLALADDAPQTAQPALEVTPARMGYAVDQPEILMRQRLFGLAHGLSLLAASCLDLPEHSRLIQDAYATWHAAQARAIETIVRDLARYYFGSRADEAAWPDLSRALGLADSIQPALREITLHAACASLPEAIRRPRYALDKLLAGTAEPGPETQVDSAAAVPPAPTFPKRAE